MSRKTNRWKARFEREKQRADTVKKLFDELLAGGRSMRLEIDCPNGETVELDNAVVRNVRSTPGRLIVGVRVYSVAALVQERKIRL